jgi:hypothetical protein
MYMQDRVSGKEAQRVLLSYRPEPMGYGEAPESDRQRHVRAGAAGGGGRSELKVLYIILKRQVGSLVK